MNKRTHKQKIKFARKLMTQKEIQKGVGVFQSQAWLKRSAGREYREHMRCKNVEHK